MTIAEPAFTLGVEEEYLLVDMETGDLASDPSESLIDECVRELGEQVTNEFLQPQVEIGTSVCTDIGEVRQELRRLRGGMHVHVGIEDEELRIDLMNQVRYFLPHLLCLTTSSPFWQGRDTGLSSYRLTVFDSVPRTGLPEPLPSWTEY